MENKERIQRRKGVAKDSHKQQDNFATKRPDMQPGSTLTDLLKRYKFDLLSLPYENHISRLVDCCDYILDEVDRGTA